MRIAAKWGLVLGLSVSIWTLALHGLGFYTTRIGAGQVADILATFLPVAAILFALHERRRSAPLPPAGAITTALAVGCVSLVLTLPFFWWYHHIVNPQWADFLIAHKRDGLIAAGRSAAEIETAIATQRASVTDRAQIIGSVMGTAVLSALIGIVAGAVFRIRGSQARSAAPTHAPHFGMYALAVIACEAIPIALLVGVVFVNGIAGSTEPPEAFAQRTALWLGPIASILTTMIVSWRLHRGRRDSTRRGFWLGSSVGALDLAIVAAMGAPFPPIVFISAVAKSAAGAFGAFVASRAARGTY